MQRRKKKFVDPWSSFKPIYFNKWLYTSNYKRKQTDFGEIMMWRNTYLYHYREVDSHGARYLLFSEYINEIKNDTK